MSRGKRIDGKKIAAHYREQLKVDVVALKEKGVTPGLAVVLVGDNPASKSYVGGKQRACKEVGIYSELIVLESTVEESELLSIIDDLNARDEIHGILVQLPLPKHISEQAVIHRIVPEKDVDGFHPENVGRMVIGESALLSCTPYGVMKMLQYEGISVEGKHAVVLGRSNIVGKPVGQLLLRENATVTYCHSRTNNLKEVTRLADILVVAVGREKMVDASYVKDGAIVIDVGINRGADGKLYGDVDFESVEPVASYITPVPGGVGPMTITMLLFNTVEACSKQNQIVLC